MLFTLFATALGVDLPPMPTVVPMHRNHKSAAVERGAGAKALRTMLPNIVVTPATNMFYFAVTAANDYGISDYSDEVTTTNPRPTVAWDPVADCGVTNYSIGRGRKSVTYTMLFNAGTNTQLTVPFPIVLSNLVVLIYGPPGLISSNWNPTGSCYWTGKNLTISAQRQ